LADFDNFWQAASRRNLTYMTIASPTHFNTVATLPCVLQKS